MITIRHRRTGETLLEREGASLRGADLRGLSLDGADSRGQFMPGADLTGAVVAGADFGGASMTGVNLTGADATAARFRRAQMDRASLLSAHLYRADLRGALIEGAVFDGSDMRGARLGGFQFLGASFRHADLREATLSGLVTSCDFEGVDLTTARLARADLSGCSFAGADLRGADLHGTDLSRASLAGADLRGAKMHGVALRLRGGIIDLFVYLFLARTILRDFFPDTALSEALKRAPWSDFSAAVSLVLLLAAAVMAFTPVAAYLKDVDLTGARYDGTTRWPRGFDPAARGAILVNGDAEPIPSGP